MEHLDIVKTLGVYKNFEDDFVCGRVSQAYLFVCDDRLTARELVMAVSRLLVCDNENSCGACGGCVKVNAGTHPDVLVYPKGKNFMVADAGQIYDNVQVKPMIASRKIFVINDIDLATEQAQNKMLKIVEEPPKNVIFLITCKNESKVLRTIISRVQKKHVDKLGANSIEKIVVSVGEKREIAITNGDGYLGKTIDIDTGEEYVKVYGEMLGIVKNLKISTQIPNFSPILGQNREFFEKGIAILSDFYRDMLMIKLNKLDIVKNVNIIKELESASVEYTPIALLEIIKRFNLARQKFDSNVNLTMLADSVLLDILEVKFLCK